MRLNIMEKFKKRLENNKYSVEYTIIGNYKSIYARKDNETLLKTISIRKIGKFYNVSTLETLKNMGSNKKYDRISLDDVDEIIRKMILN